MGGIPAARIEPGVLWKRPEGVFLDDPDVGRQYSQLCAQGEITLELGRHETFLAQMPELREMGKLAESLVRRAAEDGFRAEMHYGPLRRGKFGWRVELVGPLTPELAEPVPGWRSDATELYHSLGEGERIYLAAGDCSPLSASTSRGAYIRQELQVCAARDGYELDCDWVGWDFADCVIKLRDAEDKPARRERTDHAR